MKNYKIAIHGLVHTLGVVVYVGLVTLIMMHGAQVFGQVNNFLGQVMFLMLFIISALITGGLVLGRPIFLYFEGDKKQSLQLFFWTGFWLAIMTIIVFVIGIII